MEQVHQTISDRVEKGSGQWLLTSDEVKQWLDGSQPKFWCYGMLGVGKTVMSSIIFNHLRQNRDEAHKSRFGLAIVYLRFNEPEQTLDNVLGSILRQLLQDGGTIPDAVAGLYMHHQERSTAPTTEDMVNTLTSVLSTYDNVSVIIDALDESSEEFRWALLDAIEQLPANLRMLITSRNLEAIADDLEDFYHYELVVDTGDLELFVDRQTRKDRNLRKLVTRTPSLIDDLKREIVKTAQGMFLLARLHVDSVLSAAKINVKSVRAKLSTLPTTLNESYDEALKRVETQEADHKRIALKALAWVSYAYRSLRLLELQHALAIEPGDHELDEEAMVDAQSITSLCAGLVIIDPSTNVVSLVHYSTKTYFDDIREIRFPLFHASITLSCATYLTLKALKNLSIGDIVRSYPLACYAAQFMGEHARETPEEALDPSVLNVICGLLAHPEQRRPLLSLIGGLDLIKAGFYSTNEDSLTLDEQLQLPATLGDRESAERVEDLATTSGSSIGGPNSRARSDSMQSSDASQASTVYAETEDLWTTKLSSSRVPEVTALHLAASMGLARVAAMLLEQTPQVDAIDVTGKTALAVAIERGFEKAVELLVNSGASVDLRTDSGRSILLIVAERGWSSAGDVIARKARKAYASETSDTVAREVEYILAAYYGNVITMQNLEQQHLLDQQHDFQLAELSLFLATERAHAPAVDSLLSSGVNANAQDNSGQTTLHRAVRRGDAGLVRLLLARQANVNAKDHEGRTPWSANLRTSSADVLAILIEAGTDVNTQGLQGVSELYTASKAGEFKTVRYMLESGTNPNIATDYDWRSIHWAAADGLTDIVQLLLAHGADANAMSDQGVTPLDLCVQKDQTAMAEMLKAAGAKESKEILPPAPRPTDAGALSDDWVEVEKALNQVTMFNPSRLILVFDNPIVRTIINPMYVGQYVYPRSSTGPQPYTYQISQVFEAPDDTLAIRRAAKRAEMRDYPLPPADFDRRTAMYNIHRVRRDAQEFEMAGLHDDSIAENLHMMRDWTGGWKVYQTSSSDRKALLRSTPDYSKADKEACRWMTRDETPVAPGGWEDQCPFLSFTAEATERPMQDLIVTCWVTKLWSEASSGKVSATPWPPLAQTCEADLSRRD